MADIVKLIYKGDEMAQGGGSADHSTKFYDLDSANPSLVVAQEILDDLKNDVIPVIRLVTDSGDYTEFTIYHLDHGFERESGPGSTNTRITFYNYYIADESTTWDPSLISKGSDSNVHIQQNFIQIFYTGTLEGTPVASRIDFRKNDFAITGIYGGS